MYKKICENERGIFVKCLKAGNKDVGLCFVFITGARKVQVLKVFM